MTVKSKITQLIEFEPAVRNHELATALGISKQLVSYHIRRMGIQLQRRDVPIYASCAGCGSRRRPSARLPLCRACSRSAYVYEYTCGWCGIVQIAEGRDATSRRSNVRRGIKRSTLDFCDRKCASKYRGRQQKLARRLDPGKDVKKRA